MNYQIIEPVEELAVRLQRETGAMSVFLYGSRVRNETVEGSDWEIGVLFDEKHYRSRSEVNSIFGNAAVHIFPFRYADFQQGLPDTPFQRAFWMRDVILSGRTLAGERVVESLTSPSVTVLDVIQDLRFNLGYALAATHSFRNGDIQTAILHFIKSCLYGTRDLIVFQKRVYPLNFSEIVEFSREMNLDEFQELPSYALGLRQGENFNDQKLFNNLSYLNTFIEPRIIELFN